MIKKIALIGNGNVAFHLAKRLKETGSPIAGLVVRDQSKTSDFKSLLSRDTLITTQNDLSDFNWDIIILAVSDSAIPEIIKQFRFPAKAIALHCSGSQPITRFEESDIEKYGVLYPLQTFSKEKEIQFESVPLYIEGSNATVEKEIREFGEALSPNVSVLNSDQRLKLHMAAVIACNFSNALYSVAQSQLNEIGLNFEVLAALVAETAEKAIDIGPNKAQTGPAARKDQEVIDKHLEVLESRPEIKSIYQQLSNLIGNSQKDD
ncbi:MAG: DUF2520 domain-containing protein [Cyclobacteriaceae bacterium]